VFKLSTPSIPSISVKNAALLRSSVSSVAFVRSICPCLSILNALIRSDEFFTPNPISLASAEFSFASLLSKFLSPVPAMDPLRFASVNFPSSAVVVSTLILAAFATGATNFIASEKFSIDRAEEVNPLAITSTTL